MSASLVGSEMCIRDRSAVRPTDELKALGGAAGLPTVHVVADTAANRLACLLYTSDAADDM
eukprot:1858084-Alexandrium_andersonii.AAC.1